MYTSNGIETKKRNWNEILFYVMFVPWFSVVFISTTTFYSYIYFKLNGPARTFVAYFEVFFPLFFVALNILLLNKVKLIPKLLLLLCLTLVFLQTSSVVGYDMDLYWTVLCVLGAAGLDFKRFLKVYLSISLFWVLITTVLAMGGVIPNLVNHQYGVTRYAMGSIWCTDYASKVFFMILVTLYLYSKKMNILHWIGILAVAVLTFVATFGKLDFACMLLAIIIFFVHERIGKQDVSSKVRQIWEKLWARLAPFITPLCAAFMTLLTVVYSQSNGITVKLDNALSGRLALGKRAFSEIGVTLVGQVVHWIGMGGASRDVGPEGYNFVDCSYLNILFNYGIITILVLVALHAFIAYRNRKDTRLILVIAMISANCIIAHHFIEIAFNPFWVILLTATIPLVEKTPANQKQLAEKSDQG